MKCVVERKKIDEAVQNVSYVVLQRSPVPILQNLRFQIVGGKLEIVAADLEIGIRYYVDLKDVSDKEGVVVLPANRMSGIFKKTPDETIKIETDGNLVVISSLDGIYKIVSANPQEFPDIPKFEERDAITFDASSLREMIRKTAFAASTELTRFPLTGVLFSIRNQELRLVATDGKRMAYVKRRYENKLKDSPDKIEAIVPAKALNLLDKVITDEDETIDVKIDSSQIKFRTKKAIIFSRLIEGNFPDYEMVIPKDCDKKAKVKREELLLALERAAIVSTEKSRAVRLTFKKPKLNLFSRCPEVGEVNIDIPIDYENNELVIVFNPDLLIDGLRVIRDDDVEIEASDSEHALMLKEGRNFIYITMPLKVQL